MAIMISIEIIIRHVGTAMMFVPGAHKIEIIAGLVQQLPQIAAIAVIYVGSIGDRISKAKYIGCLIVVYSKHEVLPCHGMFIGHFNLNWILPCFYCFSGNGIVNRIEGKPGRKMTD